MASEHARSTGWTGKFARWWINNPLLSFVIMAIPTAVLAYKIPSIEVFSRFADLLPQRHEYIVTYNEMRDTFGGANVVTMSVQRNEGDIFNEEDLWKVRYLNDEVDKVKGVNHYQVASIAHRKIRRIVTDSSGMVKSKPVLPRRIPSKDARLKSLREEMFNNDIVYGTYLSEDGTAAMVLAGFNEDRLDYYNVFSRLRTLRRLLEGDNFWVARAVDRLRDQANTGELNKFKRSYANFNKVMEKQGFAVDSALVEAVGAAVDAGVPEGADAVQSGKIWGAAVMPLFDSVLDANDPEGTPKTTVYIAGEPMLKGWIYHHSGQLGTIFGITGILFATLLLLNFRAIPGLLLPIMSTGLSAVWGLGFVGWIGYNLDPLILVVPILISARTASHAVQFLERYRDDIRQGSDRKQATINTMSELITPSFIAIFTDAAGLLVLAVSSIPIIAKLGIFCCFWSGSNIVSVPLLLPWMIAHVAAPTVPASKGARADGAPEPFGQRMMFHLGNFIGSPRSNVPVGALTAVLVFGSLWYAKDVVVGENLPGSPIVFQDSDYNVAAGAINDRFAGANQMSVYLEGLKEHDMKRPDVVRTVEKFRLHMMQILGAGGTRDVPTLVRSINRLYHFDDPRWSALPKESGDIGNILFMYEAGAAIPGVILEYVDYPARRANFVTFFKDATGITVRRAITAVKEFIDAHPLEGIEYKLAGGYVGVTAAANEEIEHSELIQTCLILVVVMASVLVTYRSFTAPALVFVVLMIAVLVNRAYMGIRGIGLNVNTLPVTAVGIGIGVDYAIYILDRIKEEAQDMTVNEAIVKTLSTTGAAVVFTAITVVAGIFYWIVGSALRFNSEMALLLTLLMGGHMIGAITILPMMIRVFQPTFIKDQRGGAGDAPAQEQAGA